MFADYALEGADWEEQRATKVNAMRMVGMTYSC